MNKGIRWGLWVTVFAMTAAGIVTVIAARGLLRETVTVVPVERGVAVEAVPGVVSVAARSAMDVRSEFEGRIVESLIEPGRSVEEGAVLFRLDTIGLDAEIERVRTELEFEKTISEIGSTRRYDLKEAEEDLEHELERLEQGQSSRGEIARMERRAARLSDEIAIEEATRRHRFNQLERDLADLERRRDKMTVRAPIAGDIIDIHAYPGDIVGARSPVARLLSVDRDVKATVREENFAGLAVGQSATVRFLGYGARRFDATVSRLLPAADPETQRYTIYLDVDMPGEMALPGLTGEVSIVLDERSETLIIPRRALLGRQVFVVRDGFAELRDVEPGFVSLTHVEILEGLEEGEPIVVENLDRLRDGDRVRVMSP